MKTKEKPEVTSPLRIPKAKTRLGLKVPTIAMPHDDLIRAEKPHLEIVPPSEPAPGQSSQTRQARPTRQTGVSSQTRQSDNSEIAPTRNYQKVPNSLTRQAIPEGLFVGKSKQLYDVLYGLTRGAISPARKIRISKTKLMKQSGIGSRITFDACVNRLIAVGLLDLTVLPGEHEGNEFEVLLPEEITGENSQGSQTRQSSQSSQSTPPSQGSLTGSAQKPDSLVSLETGQTSQSLNQADTATYEDSKTSFKDFKDDDDEAFAGMTEIFQKLSERLTGKSVSSNQKGNWRELAELLAMEMEVAAARTEAISNIPAFLTEHLRRRLAPRREIRESRPIKDTSKGTSKSLNVGKSAATGNPEPLGEFRETVLNTFRQFIADGKKDYIFTLEETYTPEDWKYLTAKMED